MTLLPGLQRDLVDAARRIERRPLGLRVRRSPASGRRRARASRPAAALIVLAAAFALVFGAGAVGAVTGLWSAPSIGAWTGLSRKVLGTTKPPSSSLMSILGVLRRPQTTADRDRSVVKFAAAGPERPVVELSGVRLATRLANGVQIYLVPERASPLVHKQTGLDEAIFVSVAVHGRPAGGGCCLDAKSIRTIAPAGLTGETPRGAATITIVVPDGVARVRLLFGRQVFGAQVATGQAYPTPLTLDIPVRGNVAAATTTARTVEDLQPLRVTWYAPDGHTVATANNPRLPHDPNMLLPRHR